MTIDGVALVTGGAAGLGEAIAHRLAVEGAAVVVADVELDGTRLRTELDPLLADPPRLDAMSRAARTLARPDATARFADLVEEAARG